MHATEFPELFMQNQTFQIFTIFTKPKISIENISCLNNNLSIKLVFQNISENRHHVHMTYHFTFDIKTYIKIIFVIRKQLYNR